MMKIQVVGLGGIGKNLIRLINQKNGLLKSKFGETIEVVSVSDTSGTVVTDGMSLLNVIHAKESGGLRELDSFERISARKAIENIDADLVVEVTQSTQSGEPGIGHTILAMENGKDVVTANKGILASDFDMISKARDMKRILKYEATVCGSIPVFNLINYSIGPASIKGISGIFNATSTYIATMMEQGKTREEAIEKAIEMGLAEKNYRDDTEGRDSARKGVILHRSIYQSKIKLEEVKFGNMINMPAAGMRLFTEVDQKGVSVKYISLEDQGKNKVNGISMSITFLTDIFDNLTLAVEHDGPRESAATVLNDIMLTALENSRK